MTKEMFTTTDKNVAKELQLNDVPLDDVKKQGKILKPGQDGALLKKEYRFNCTKEEADKIMAKATIDDADPMVKENERLRQVIRDLSAALSSKGKDPDEILVAAENTRAEEAIESAKEIEEAVDAPVAAEGDDPEESSRPEDAELIESTKSPDGK